MNVIDSLHSSARTDDGDDRLFVGSVEKAFKVLEAFGTDRRDLGLMQIVARSGLNKSAAQRFAHTLYQLGYLEKDPSSRRYMLSKRVLESANSFLRVDPLVNKAIPHIAELRRQINARVGLACLHGMSAMYLIPLQSNQVVLRTTHPGHKIPLYCTTTGRVLLAHRGEEEARAFIESCDRQKVTPMTITDVERIMEEIRQVRAQGYCITDQENRMGDINAAAPVFDGDSTVIATVVAACSRSEWARKEVVAKVAPLVMQTARAISADG